MICVCWDWKNLKQWKMLRKNQKTVDGLYVTQLR